MSYDAVRKYLISKHMRALDDWIRGCVDHFCTPGYIHDEEYLKKKTEEQWLLNDLKEVCIGYLPANLKEKSKITLDGRFVLQINSAIDIGTSAYQQLLKLQKVNMENVEATTSYEDKISSHRMIKLEMTDGVQDVEAIEYKPMRKLNCDIIPGCKVLIKGPVECRRGMLLLSDDCIEQMLGGEVGEYLESKSLSVLLSAKLGLSTQVTRVNTTPAISHQVTSLPTPPSSTEPLRSPFPNDAFPDDAFPYEAFPDDAFPESTVRDDEFPDDDHDLYETAAHIEEQSCLKRFLKEDSGTNPVKKLKVNSASTSNTSNVVSNTEQTDTIDLTILDSQEDPHDHGDIEEKAAHIPEKNLTSPRNNEAIYHENEHSGPITSPEPFVYIKQINEMSESAKASKAFKIKGQIIRMQSKLSIDKNNKDKWCLNSIIGDGTGIMVAEFESDVLEKLIGHTPKQLKQITREPAARESVQQTLESVFRDLCCIMVLKIEQVPKITQLIDINDGHLQLLKRRVERIKK